MAPHAHCSYSVPRASCQVLAHPSASRYREALHSFQAAVRLDPTDPLAHFRIGNAFFALRKYPDARKARARALLGPLP